MPKSKAKTKTHSVRRRAARYGREFRELKNIEHMERLILKVDAENDRLQKKFLLLSILSVLLTLVGVIFAFTRFG
jgi:hypothetical protein